MATEAQIAANRRNSQKSTGPKSPPGKRISSLNSTKHGLAGSTTASLLAADSDRAVLEERMAQWRPAFDPRGPDEEYLFEVVVTESIRAGRCVDAYFALCRDHARRARLCWDADRRRAADELAARLPREPHRASRRLEETPQGCDRKLESWRGLSASLERHRTWTEAQRSMALDLLGVHRDLRDAETPVDPASGDDLAARRAVVASELARLEALRDGDLAARDAEERALAEATVGAELTLPLQLMNRYEMAALRRERWAWKKLDAARKARALDASPAPPLSAAAPPSPTVRVPLLSGSLLDAAPRPSPRFESVPALAVAAPPREPSRPSAPRNRHERRAQAAMARQAAH